MVVVKVVEMFPFICCFQRLSLPDSDNVSVGFMVFSSNSTKFRSGASLLEPDTALWAPIYHQSSFDSILDTDNLGSFFVYDIPSGSRPMAYEQEPPRWRLGSRNEYLVCPSIVFQSARRKEQNYVDSDPVSIEPEK
jgi:hypothetical protein